MERCAKKSDIKSVINGTSEGKMDDLVLSHIGLCRKCLDEAFRINKAMRSYSFKVRIKPKDQLVRKEC